MLYYHCLCVCERDGQQWNTFVDAVKIIFLVHTLFICVYPNTDSVATNQTNRKKNAENYILAIKVDKT